MVVVGLVVVVVGLVVVLDCPELSVCAASQPRLVPPVTPAFKYAATLL